MSRSRRFDGAVFTPISDHDLNPASDIRGALNLGYCFFEYPLGPKARENAKRYDLIFCGSSWCQRRLAEIGVTHTEVLIQGVDEQIFKPEPIKRNDNEIWIFSGGKFEYRKGQDLVLAAFKILLKDFPRARLVTAWHNPWPELYASMLNSEVINVPGEWPAIARQLEWPKALGFLLTANEIPKERVLYLTPGPPEAMALAMNQTDFAVFPNRCEGGTNLVMMEYLACGKPVIANVKTGHSEMARWIHSDIPARAGVNLWAEQRVEDIAEKMADGMKGFPSKLDAPKFPWSRPAQQIISAIERLCNNRTVSQSVP